MKKIKKILLSLIIASLPIVSFISVSAAEQNPTLTLMYHEICTDKKYESSFTLSSATFEEDIKLLINKGYNFYFASEMDDFLNNTDGKNGVVITFDDGYESGYTKVLPILEKYQIKATFFIIGRHIDTEQFLSTEQLRALSESPYVEIGSHSNRIHGNPTDYIWDLYKRDAMSALADFNENAKIIEGITSKKVTSASFPYGIYTEYLNALMNYNGYTTYSSIEQPCLKGNTPYPRYNRSGTYNLSNIIQHASSTGLHPNQYYPYKQQKNTSAVTVYANGSKYYGNVIMENDSTILPVSFLTENLNAYSSWIEQGAKLLISKNDKEIILTKGSEIAFVNGEAVTLCTPVFSSNFELYVPARFIAETFGAEINWDAKHRSVLIY